MISVVQNIDEMKLTHGIILGGLLCVGCLVVIYNRERTSQTSEDAPRLSGPHVALGDAVSYSGVGVQIVKRDAADQHLREWLDAMRRRASGIHKETKPVEILETAITCRILWDISTNLSRVDEARACQQCIVELESKFEEAFGIPHPAIMELMVQCNTKRNNDTARETRIQAAKLGCVQSLDLIRDEIGVNTSVVDYFGGVKEAYTFALVEMLYDGSRGTSMNLEGDHSLSVYCRLLRGDPGIVSASLDFTEGDSMMLFHGAIREAILQWNRRYVPRVITDLDLREAWLATSARG